MYDGAINRSGNLYCRSLENGYPKYYFVGHEDFEHAHADGVFSLIGKAMYISSSVHWKEKVVGGGSDGTSVNNIVSRRLSDGSPMLYIALHIV